jgi:hypothetical protein
MARIDDFQQARDLAARQLAQQEMAQIARRSGFEAAGSSALRAPFLNRFYHLAAPQFIFTDEADPAAPVPLQEQVLILHYLLGCQPRLKRSMGGLPGDTGGRVLFRSLCQAGRGPA